MSEIVNRVANSGIQSIDLDELISDVELHTIDLADQLWQGIALKETEFRTYIKEHQWNNYSNNHVAVLCSADAIIPSWAWMLIASALEKNNASYSFCTPDELDMVRAKQAINNLNAEQFADARIVIKGCSKVQVTPEIYMSIIHKLQPLALSIMFGEPCSTVPVYKKPRKSN